jgi:amino acid adenylation domain-containing protein
MMPALSPTVSSSSAQSNVEMTGSPPSPTLGGAPDLAQVRRLLRGKPAPTPLPRSAFTHAVPARTGTGALVASLDPELERRLGALAQRNAADPDTVLQAAWAIVLSRFTGDDDVLFGVSRAGAPSLASQVSGQSSSRLAGAGALPLRVPLSPATSVRQLLSTIQLQSVGLRGLEQLPLAELQAQSEVPPALPLFESVLLFADCEPTTTSVRPAADQPPPLQNRSVREQPAFPLTLEVSDAHALELRLLFSRERLDETLAGRLLDAVRFCLSELAGSDDERPLGEIEVVPPAERHKLLLTWNDTAQPFDDRATLHQLFERRAQAQPEARAVEIGGLSLSYCELEQRANRIAHALRERGVGPGAYVGICLHRSLDLIAAMLAVSKAGAAYVPLDPHYPVERLRRMVEDSAAALVVTESGLQSIFQTPALVLGSTAASGQGPTSSEDAGSELASCPSHALAPSTDSTADCYALYTSGSTGTPKGVVLTHRAVVNTLEWVNRTFEVGPGDRALFVTSPSFDLSVYDVFGVLAAGATVVVAEESLLADPGALARALIERQITVWNSAPSFLQLVLPFVATAARSTARAPALRLALLSGDWIPLGLVETARGAFPGARLISLGGATEAAIWSNWFPIETLEPHWASVPYGKPIQNCRYHVLDDRRKPVPVGATGELYIGGECLARGYLNRAELTAERFIPDPFAGLRGDPDRGQQSGQNGARLYRTGDLARYYEDGNLELLGRLDGQLKIRGFRVEIAEVEAALAALPELAQAVCSTLLDGSGQRALAAYVVPRPDQAVTEASVKQALARTLPDFMVPARVSVLDSLPLTANGKVDRGALSGLKEQRGGAEVSPLATETERRVAAIWERMLQRSPIGGSDNFFALGGHSLLAIQTFNEIERQLGVPVHVAALFEYPTLALLAARIDQLRLAATDAASDWTTLVPIHPQGSLPPLFCVAGAGGNPIGQRNLAPILGPEQPLYALRHRGVDGRQAPHTDIQDMADECLADIQSIQPRGPYYLAGFSGGGVVAYELARMLRDRGEDVPLLVLLDAYNPAVAKKPFSQRVRGLLRLTRRYGFGHLLQRLVTHGARALEKLRLKLESWRRRPDRIESRDLGLVTSFRAAVFKYSPGTYSGDTLLVRCKIDIPVSAEGDSLESNGWAPLISGHLEVVTVDCEHEELLGTHAAVTAQHMRSALEAARSGRC